MEFLLLVFYMHTVLTDAPRARVMALLIIVIINMIMIYDVCALLRANVQVEMSSLFEHAFVHERGSWIPCLQGCVDTNLT